VLFPFAFRYIHKNIFMYNIENELQTFTSQSVSLAARTKQIALALAPNTAQVWPGGAVFNSIQAAIDSITGANALEQYQVAVGTGTFNENVVMKDYVYVIGSGQDKTIITAAPLSTISGVVNSASGCGISECTINAPGAAWGSWPVGIKITGSGKFHISGVTMNCGTGATGNNVRGITNNTGSETGNIILSQSIINLTGDSQTACSGIELFGGIILFINLTSIQANGQGQNFCITTATGSTVTLDDSKIIANSMALDNSDGTAPITANQCTIDGPVSGGVVVNN
jgi:hypothetical protein